MTGTVTTASPPSSAPIAASPVKPRKLSANDAAYISAVTRRASLLESTGLSAKESLIMAHSTLLPTLEADSAENFMVNYILATLVSIAVAYTPVAMPTAISTMATTIATTIGTALCPPCQAAVTSTTLTSLSTLTTLTSYFPSFSLASLLPLHLDLDLCRLTCIVSKLSTFLFLSLTHYLLTPFHLPQSSHTLINVSFVLLHLYATSIPKIMLLHCTVSSVMSLMNTSDDDRVRFVVAGVISGVLLRWNHEVLENVNDGIVYYTS